MGEYSRQEVAERAGVGVDDVSRLVELGILMPSEGDRFSVGDVRRVALVLKELCVRAAASQGDRRSGHAGADGSADDDQLAYAQRP